MFLFLCKVQYVHQLDWQVLIVEEKNISELNWIELLNKQGWNLKTFLVYGWLLDPCSDILFYLFSGVFAWFI